MREKKPISNLAITAYQLLYNAYLEHQNQISHQVVETMGLDIKDGWRVDPIKMIVYRELPDKEEIE